jgi:hypothetical protein
VEIVRDQNFVRRHTNWIFVYVGFEVPMLGGSLVITAWRVLTLRMEEEASRYGG